ncbi:peptidase inhibitor family I36 protein [uncultured Tessaracoccus sp.]|uniref:peptidase inhibitor family I36 protein n=1 Tax=uncultured Tessaracoccus sp. TaxID=905023 RepID=UPI0025FA3956|nr:peptidase inhibitor family I36 protein [uncultured Tessaracoccus sp.]
MAVAAATLPLWLGQIPAHAAAGDDCAKGYVCVYADGGLRGAHKDVPASSVHYNLGTFRDKASSWYNRTSKPVCIYDYEKGTGKRKQLNRVMPGEKVMIAPDGTNDRADAVGHC